MKILKSVSFVSLFFLQSGCSLFGVRKEETPKYQVLLTEGDKEVRAYDTYIVAKTPMSTGAQNESFRVLANYIFGGNSKKQKMSMTAPVAEAKAESEKIAMTAPVIMSPSGEMTFMMPSKYKLEDLPTPNDPRVKLEEVPAKIWAVLRFTGLWGEERKAQKLDELKAWVQNLKEYEPAGPTAFAAYDPPWTLPFLRRNETMIEVRLKNKF
jgi:hypothetical protein